MGSIAHPVFSLKIHKIPPPREIFSLCLWHTFIAAVEGWAKKEQQQQTHGAEEALIPITLCWSFVRTLPLTSFRPVSSWPRQTVESTSGCRRPLRLQSCHLRLLNRTVFSPIRNALADGCALSSHCHQEISV